MWANIGNILLGLWLMVAPALLGFDAAASDNGHIAGPLIVTFSTIALWEATSAVTKWNLPIAIWLLAAPWVLGYDMWLPTANDMISGALILTLSLQKRTIKKRYGGGWSALWNKENQPGTN